jgi:class 3 adenylate cyclase
MHNTKLTAVVMFSDVVGYTAMMGDDEAAALLKLHENHRIQKSLIEKYKGTFACLLFDFRQCSILLL